jgi:hypothetical protein
MDYSSIKINNNFFDYLQNKQWKPSLKDFDLIANGGLHYNESMNVFKGAEKNVIFENTSVEYDSCDCGDGYGCSHGLFPVSIIFEGNPNVESEIEEDQIYLHHNGFSIWLPFEKANMQDFIDACKLLKINLNFKDSN